MSFFQDSLTTVFTVCESEPRILMVVIFPKGWTFGGTVLSGWEIFLGKGKRIKTPFQRLYICLWPKVAVGAV